jgi:hypothetical protein
MAHVIFKNGKSTNVFLEHPVYKNFYNSEVSYTFHLWKDWEELILNHNKWFIKEFKYIAFDGKMMCNYSLRSLTESFPL